MSFASRESPEWLEVHRPPPRCVLTCCLCCRQGLRVHYPSQTAAPSRTFPDFLLRAPAASVSQPQSGSTTEASESDDEDGAAAAAEPTEPAPRGVVAQQSQQQETLSELKSSLLTHLNKSLVSSLSGGCFWDRFWLGCTKRPA